MENNIFFLQLLSHYTLKNIIFNIGINYMNKKDIQNIRLKKMIFIWNALDNGWAVSKINSNIYQFKQKHNEIGKKINLNITLLDFVESNLNINKIIKENI